MVFTLDKKEKGRGGEKRNIERAGRTGSPESSLCCSHGKGLSLPFRPLGSAPCSQHCLLSFSIGYAFKEASQSALLNKDEGNSLENTAGVCRACCLMCCVMQELVCDPTIKGCITVQPRRINPASPFMFPACAGQCWLLLSLLHSLS